MSLSDQFAKAISEQKRKTESRNPLIAGTLGITMGGQTIVEVPDRPSYVYVMVRSSTAEVIQAFNQVVSPVYGLPVFIQWQGNRYVVTERDTMRYSNWIDSSAYLPRHASTHEFAGSAGDVVFVSQQQFLPLMPSPSGSLGNAAIIVQDYNLMSTGGNFIYFPAQATVNMTAWNPSSPTGAVMALVTLDASNGQLKYFVNSGTVFGNWLTGTADVLPKVASVPDIGRYLPIAAIRLVNGTQIITWDNIYDVRPLYGVTRGGFTAQTIGGGGAGSGVAVLNNGLLVNYANQLNLLGSNFTITSSGTEAELTINAGGGGGTSGSLLLDTSNGPLYGPLVIYQKNPGAINQYFDFSTLVAFISGTQFGDFGAAVEAANWSTGNNSYGVYVDDEGSNLGMFIGGQGKMDNTLFELYDTVGFNWNGGKFLNPMVLWTRDGNNKTMLVAPLLSINERQINQVAAPTIEIDANFSAVTSIYPLITGSPWTDQYPFPYNGAAYGWDTYNDLYAINTGTVHSYWNNQSTVISWLTPKGDMVIRQLRIREYPPAFGTPPVSGSFSQGIINLVNGTATIKTTAVTMSSRIYLTTQFGSGTHVGYNYVYSRMAGSGFTIRSSDLSDTSLVAWLLVEPS